MSFQNHISAVCQSSYFELRKISSIRHYLSFDATKVLMCSLVLSRLDYGNALLAGSFEYLLDRFQKVQNNAARLICKSSKKKHVTPLLKSLHWLPVRSRIKYKLACLCYSYFSGTGPTYLSDMLTQYSTLPKLRSSSDQYQLRNPGKEVNTKTFGERSFRYQGPLVWSSLPESIRNSPSPSSFRTALKTHLFRSVYT